MSKDNYTLRCPKCSAMKEPEWMIGSRSYSVYRLDIPYFMCGECRLICLDKITVRKAISEWRDTRPKSIVGIPPHEYIYQEMLRTLNKVVDYYCQTAGYRRIRFKKIIP